MVATALGLTWWLGREQGWGAADKYAARRLKALSDELELIR
jgi:hypothetical protein